MPSRRLDEITTWQKPFTFSASIRRRMDWQQERGCQEQCIGHGPAQHPLQTAPTGLGQPAGAWGAGSRARGAWVVGCRALRQDGSVGWRWGRPGFELHRRVALRRAEQREFPCQGSDGRQSSN